MHRVDAPGNLANQFTDGNPAGGVPPTDLREKWHNAAQEEILGPIEYTGLTPDDADNGQLLAALQIMIPDGGVLFKNALINGAFDIRQRGSSFTRTTDGETYTADRWAMRLNGITVGSVTVTDEVLAPNAWSIGGLSPWATRFLRIDNSGGFTTGGTGEFGVIQKIEGVRALAGKTVSVSFKAKADSAVVGKVRLTQDFGTGGSPSADVVVDDTISITTAWALYSVQLALSDISAKTVGTIGDDFLGLNIFSEDGSGVILDIAEIQVEEGAMSTVYEQKHWSVELGLCLRYYEKSYNQGADPGSTGTGGIVSALNAGTASGVYGCSIAFSVKKRAQPTMTWYSPTTGASGNVRNTTLAADAPVGSTVYGNYGSTGIPSLITPITANVILAHWTADAEM